MKIWCITGNSESGDEGTPRLYNYKPDESAQKDYIEYMFGEQLDIDGPGDFGSYVYLTIEEIELLVKGQKLCS